MCHTSNWSHLRYFCGPSGRGYARKPSVREPTRLGSHVIFAFPTFMVHGNSKNTCLVPSKSTPYVPRIELVAFELRVPEINDCIFAEELVKLFHIYIRLGNTLVREKVT